MENGLESRTHAREDLVSQSKNLRLLSGGYRFDCFKALLRLEIEDGVREAGGNVARI